MPNFAAAKSDTEYRHMFHVGKLPGLIAERCDHSARAHIFAFRDDRLAARYECIHGVALAAMWHDPDVVREV